ncbi:MAG: hypothetical protein M3372_01445 [Verrucomicrobiota bacterium]|nr:hypothetical protein [Verrucomicrobiota bacterium]
MSTRLNQFVCGAAVLLGAISVSHAQFSSPAPAPLSSPIAAVPAAPATDLPVKTVTGAPAPGTPSTGATDRSSMMLVQASTATVPAASPAGGATGMTTGTAPAMEMDPTIESGGVGVREFQGDDAGQVLRLLARQAKINMVVSDQIPPASTVTMRLEDVTALQAIEIIARSKGLFITKIDNVYYVKTAAEREQEPTESGSYQFSYAQVAKPESLSVTASGVGGDGGGGSGGGGGGTAGGSMSAGSATPNAELLALIKNQLRSGLDPQFDLRTNTVFFREAISNIDNFRRFLVQIDKPTKQVMIEARLVEVTANPKQAYGINWAGVVGSKDAPQSVSYGTNQGGFTLPSSNNNVIGNFGQLAQGAFAILSVPQMSITLQALNEDNDAEFLANPRIVTADNLPAKIQIVRAQPVANYIPGGAGADGELLPPTFSGTQDKLFGNTLLVRPSVNKDSFVTLSVKPEISNKVGDASFPVAGSGGIEIKSPIIDTRSVESNVLIRSGDTLAIGGLIQDEVRKSRTKVPVMGDIPVLGYLFQSRANERVKRNLLVFVTPTILDQSYGTGLEDQVGGLHHSGEEFADPNGWRNNAKGAVRLLPTSNRQRAADYPKPGIPPAPVRTGSSSKVRFMTDAKDRDF